MPKRHLKLTVEIMIEHFSAVSYEAPSKHCTIVMMVAVCLDSVTVIM